MIVPVHWDQNDWYTDYLIKNMISYKGYQLHVKLKHVQYKYGVNTKSNATVKGEGIYVKVYMRK